MAATLSQFSGYFRSGYKMNSSHTNSIEQPITNFLEVCKRRFPTNCVAGNGRYAVYAPAAGPLSKILLFDTHAEAVRQIVDPRYAQVVDLGFDADAALENMPDLEDADERRKRRREARLSAL
jgi:hypothetical protein